MTSTRPTRLRGWVSTRSDVERLLVLACASLRVVSLVQTVVGVSLRSVVSAQAWVVPMTCLAAITVESVALFAWLLRRGGAAKDRRPVVVDALAAVLGLIVFAGCVPQHERTAAWGMGIYAVTMSTAALIGIAANTVRMALIGVAGLAGCYLAAVSLPFQSWQHLPAGVTNAAAYPAFTCVGWLLAQILRNLADDADQARLRTVELERQHSRATVHDLLPYLRPDRFIESDERTRALMVQRAKAKYQQMRDYVDGIDHGGELSAHLQAIVDLHPRLNVWAMFELEPGTDLPAETRGCLLRAVDTALSNVEQNAPSAAVAVTASARPPHSAQTVTITVHDDGPGFDRTAVSPGFGISQILGRQLSEIGGHGHVMSQPGKGTKVTIVVPREHD